MGRETGRIKKFTTLHRMRLSRGQSRIVRGTIQVLVNDIVGFAAPPAASLDDDGGHLSVSILRYNVVKTNGDTVIKEVPIEGIFYETDNTADIDITPEDRRG